jgi:hypothetical protein
VPPRIVGSAIRAGVLAISLFVPVLAQAADVAASPPRTISVTIYRAPYGNGGSLSLDNLQGFALVTETRVVRLPAGDNRLRFEGVADGIIPDSAIVTGLPGGVIEKNRDAAVLSPDALMRAAVGSDLTLRRTNRKTGKVERIAATLRSAGENGVVFQTAQGVETLKCSGAPETFAYGRVPAGLSSTPVLSAVTRTTRAVMATVTLSYLTQGFDWAADYTATINRDGKSLDLGAWITLANGNGAGFPNARTQIVAGRVNRAGEATWLDPAPRVIATCWPSETTSDVMTPRDIDLVQPYGFSRNRLRGGVVLMARRRMFRLVAPVAMAVAAPAPPPPPPPEQLGDLKLYRTPRPITIASRQSKQTRLLEQPAVAFSRIYQADLWSEGQGSSTVAQTILRTRNDEAHRLGLPLPAGHMVIYQDRAGGAQLAGETDLRDTANDEDIDLKLGPAPDIHVRQTRLAVDANPPIATPLAPPLKVIRPTAKVTEQVEVSNAGARDIAFELRLNTGAGRRVVGADQPMDTKDGRPIFRMSVPAGARTVVTYQVE